MLLSEVGDGAAQKATERSAQEATQGAAGWNGGEGSWALGVAAVGASKEATAVATESLVEGAPRRGAEGAEATTGREDGCISSTAVTEGVREAVTKWAGDELTAGVDSARGSVGGSRLIRAAGEESANTVRGNATEAVTKHPVEMVAEGATVVGGGEGGCAASRPAAGGAVQGAPESAPAGSGIGLAHNLSDIETERGQLLPEIRNDVSGIVSRVKGAAGGRNSMVTLLRAVLEPAAVSVKAANSGGGNFSSRTGCVPRPVSGVESQSAPEGGRVGPHGLVGAAGGARLAVTIPEATSASHVAPGQRNGGSSGQCMPEGGIEAQRRILSAAVGAALAGVGTACTVAASSISELVPLGGSQAERVGPMHPSPSAAAPTAEAHQPPASRLFPSALPPSSSSGTASSSLDPTALVDKAACSDLRPAVTARSLLHLTTPTSSVPCGASSSLPCGAGQLKRRSAAAAPDPPSPLLLPSPATATVNSTEAGAVSLASECVLLERTVAGTCSLSLSAPIAGVPAGPADSGGGRVHGGMDISIANASSGARIHNLSTVLAAKEGMDRQRGTASQPRAGDSGPPSAASHIPFLRTSEASIGPQNQVARPLFGETGGEVERLTIGDASLPGGRLQRERGGGQYSGGEGKQEGESNRSAAEGEEVRGPPTPVCQASSADKEKRGGTGGRARERGGESSGSEGEDSRQSEEGRIFQSGEPLDGASMMQTEERTRDAAEVDGLRQQDMDRQRGRGKEWGRESERGEEMERERVTKSGIEFEKNGEKESRRERASRGEGNDAPAAAVAEHADAAGSIVAAAAAAAGKAGVSGAVNDRERLPLTGLGVLLSRRRHDPRGTYQNACSDSDSISISTKRRAAGGAESRAAAFPFTVSDERLTHSAPPAAAGEAAAAAGQQSQWWEILAPVGKMPTNNGGPIRDRVRDALRAAPPPPGWAVERLEWSISKGVYKGNAAGPTKVRLV